MGKKLRIFQRRWYLGIIALSILFLGLIYASGYVRDFIAHHILCVNNQEVITKEENITNIEEMSYVKEGVEASYPRLLSGGSPESLEKWNEIIKRDFDKILQIYSFQPFPESIPNPTGVVPIFLKITYEVKANTDSRLSLFYRADYNSIYSAHPSNLIYTTNIDKKRDKRLSLRDVVQLNEAFVKDFRNWSIKAGEEDSPEIQEAIHEYIKNITDEELLTGFRAADRIGSNNPWGIYSYQTQDNLGISIEVPHYAGDHAEFEQSLGELEKKGMLKKE